jgi:hypothetical protein
MKKQILTFALAGVFALAGASAALATCNISPNTSYGGVTLFGTNDTACVDFNIHGASAEYDFFNAAGQNFLGASGLNCAHVYGPQGVMLGTVNDLGKYGAVVGNGCTIPNETSGTYTVVFRYSSKASWDGVAGITGENEMTSLAVGQLGCSSTSVGYSATPTPGCYGAGYTNATGDLDACYNVSQSGTAPAVHGPNYRTYADESSSTNWAVASGNMTNTLCAQANVGAADVAANELKEQSHGSLKGPLGSYPVTRNFSGGVNLSNGGTPSSGASIQFPITSDTTGDTVLVVPFSFYVSDLVTAYTCSSGSLNAGAFCDPNATVNECEDPRTASGFTSTYTGTAATGSCVSGQLNNITREMALLIFSGQIDYWTDFGNGFGPASPTPIYVCYRHAGSGSHATLDWTVMHAVGKSIALLKTAQGATNGPEGTASKNLWFNDGTSDAFNCANQGNTTTGVSTVASITYMDSDYVAVQEDRFAKNPTSVFIHSVQFNGIPGVSQEITNGSYDFFTTEHLYWNSTSLPTTSAQYQIYQALVGGTPGSLPSGITPVAGVNWSGWIGSPSNLPADEAFYWALPCQMQFDETGPLTTSYPVVTGYSCN